MRSVAPTVSWRPSSSLRLRHAPTSFRPGRYRETRGRARRGPTDEELKRVHARTQSRFVLGLQSNVARAQRLAVFELYRGDATTLNGELERHLAVTKDDIRHAVTTYLNAHRKNVVEVKPSETMRESSK